MTRTPLKERSLPGYTRKEEIANMTTHIVGAGVGVIVFALSIWIAFVHQNVWSLVSGAVYGLSLILLYTVSSVYHGLIPSLGKKVMQVIDHCTIYTLIAGTYTPSGPAIPVWRGHCWRRSGARRRWPLCFPPSTIKNSTPWK